MGGKTKELFTFGHHNEHSIAEGYLKSAELVVRYGAAQGGFRPIDDLLIYPFMFSLRQAVELALKEMITAISKIKGKDPLELYENNFSDHNLEKLLGVIKELSREKSLTDLYNLSGSDEEFVSHLNRLDPNAASFRYCKTSTGQKIDTFLRQKIDVVGSFTDTKRILEKSLRYCFELEEKSENVYSYSKDELNYASLCILHLEEVLNHFKKSPKWLNQGSGIDEDGKMDLDILFKTLAEKDEIAKELRKTIPDKTLINATKGYYFGRNGFFDGQIDDDTCRRKLFEVEVTSIELQLKSAKEKLNEIKGDRSSFSATKSNAKRK